MEKIPQLYQVKWRREKGEYKYGIVDRFGEEVEKAWKEARAIFVEDAIIPDGEWVYYDRDEIVPIECSFGNEYDQYVEAEFKKAQEKSKNATGLVGKLFNVCVADGYANYVVVKENKKTLKVEWRGFGLDRYMDAMMGIGGTFPKDRIERLIRAKEGLAALFAAHRG